MENIIFQTITKTGKKISFRYPTIDDVEILKDYINRISTEKSFILLQGFQHSLETETNWLKDKLEKISKQQCVYLCGFYQDKLVACAEITMGTEAKSHVGEFGISVAADFRGDGIGEKIMELVISESIKNIKDLKIIKLECFASNPIAPNLYKKMGFIEYSRLPDSLERRGEFVDAILMYKNI